MAKTKAAWKCCNITTPKTSIPPRKDKPIISEYERGTRWAGWLFVAMFCVLSLGSWWFGW